jgi:hypothetical protein
MMMRESWMAKYSWIKTCEFECGLGWDEILDKLFVIMDEDWKKMDCPDTAKFSAIQVKQKFGTLRIYLTGEVTERVHGMVAMAESMSAITCENCGSSGARLKGQMRMQTLCQSC